MSGRPGDVDADVLVVGAGPTGLTLAAQAHAAGACVQVVERRLEPRPESRAIAIHARTLEALRPLGVARPLVERGLSAVELQVHAGRRTFAGTLSGSAIPGTPSLLFLPQADTETVLEEDLAARGVPVRRGIEFVAFDEEGRGVTATLRHAGGSRERVRARFLAGCDGADSTVRSQARIAFPGSAYRQSVLLADLEVDGDLEPGALHAFLSRRGILFFFPLDRDATWRMLTIRPCPAGGPRPVPLSHLQQVADRFSGGALRLRAPERVSEIHLEHRLADRYRSGRAFLAGDAAHVHSPAGAQGMNTGMQDACNLGWKLALVTRGAACDGLLDTYEPERRPVARLVRRLTDLAFLVEGSDNALIGLGRQALAPLVAPLALRHEAVMRAVTRVVSGVQFRYDGSPLSAEGSPRLRRGARAGRWLPDAEVLCAGRPLRLYDVLTPGSFHVLLCGPSWDERHVTSLTARFGAGAGVHRLVPRPEPGALHDHTGRALSDLGVTGDGQYVVRPDRYVSYRSGGTDLAGLRAHLARWLSPARPGRGSR